MALECLMSKGTEKDLKTPSLSSSCQVSLSIFRSITKLRLKKSSCLIPPEAIVYSCVIWLPLTAIKVCQFIHAPQEEAVVVDMDSDKHGL